MRSRNNEVKANFPIVGSFNKEIYLDIDGERTINLYEYQPRMGGKTPKVLLPTPGIRDINVNVVNNGTGFRLSFKFKDSAYHVVGNRVYFMNSSLQFQFLFDMDTVEGYVGVASNDNNQIMFVDGLKGYVVDHLTGSLTVIQSSGSVFFPDNPVDVASLDGFLVAIDGESDPPVFFLSALNNATDWSIEQEGAVYEGNGNLVAVRSLHGRLFLFKETATAVWYNAGIGSELPFRPLRNMTIDFGTVNASNVVSQFDRIMFLSQTDDSLGPVMEISGTQPVAVSTQAIDNEFQSFAADPEKGVSDASGMMVKENGSIFYRLNFTKANNTYVYNSTQSSQQYRMWHEEQTLDGGRHPAQTHLYINGNNYSGDYKNSNFYKVSQEFSTNDGELIRRRRICIPIDSLSRIRVDRLHLDLKQGQLVIIKEETANLITQSQDQLITESEDNYINNETHTEIVDEDIKIFLRLSFNGGITFGPFLEANMGDIGQTNYWTVWRKLGATQRGQAFVAQFDFYHKIPLVILGGTWVYSQLPQ